MARTHYENLKVARTATKEEIQRAYRVLAQKWHPDKNTHRIEEAENNIKIINEAYRVLSNSVLRQDHDTWIRKLEIESTLADGHTYNSGGYNSGTYNGSVRYSSSNNPYRKKRRNRPAKSNYKVSKKHFALGVLALICVPTVIGVIVLNADRFSGFVVKLSVDTTIEPDKVAENSTESKDLEKYLIDFFGATNQSLLFITNSDTAIAALPRLEQWAGFIEDIANQLEDADDTTRSNVSRVAAFGLRSIGPEITRLQSDSRIWAILYPILNPMIQTLRRIVG